MAKHSRDTQSADSAPRTKREEAAMEIRKLWTCSDPGCHEDFIPVFEEMCARGRRVDELEKALEDSMNWAGFWRGFRRGMLYGTAIGLGAGALLWALAR